MIVEKLLDLVGWIVGAVADLFGPWTPPDELVDASKSINGLLTNMAGLGAWMNWGVLAGCVATATAAWGVVVGIKLVRAIAAHIPFLGGAGD